MLLKVFAALTVLLVVYMIAEVAMFLWWAYNQDPSENSDWDTYTDENKGGILARYCG